MNRILAIAALAASAGIAALGFSAIPDSHAQEGPTAASVFSKTEDAAIRAIVADWIAANPEALIEALNAYAAAENSRAAERQAAAQAEALPYLASEKGGFVAGPNVAGATVAVIEFFDYQCGFCKRANGLVRELTGEDPSVKIVFRELPILSDVSEVAARYALASRDQGRYLDLHFALMDERGALTESRIIEIASKKGLDVDRLKRDAKRADIEADLARNYSVAQEIGVDGTPGFIIAALDGSFIQLIPGFRPEELRAAIAEAKKSAR